MLLPVPSQLKGLHFLTKLIHLVNVRTTSCASQLSLLLSFPLMKKKQKIKKKRSCQPTITRTPAVFSGQRFLDRIPNLKPAQNLTFPLFFVNLQSLFQQQILISSRMQALQVFKGSC
jgi:hypothetical protein